MMCLWSRAVRPSEAHGWWWASRPSPRHPRLAQRTPPQVVRRHHTSLSTASSSNSGNDVLDAPDRGLHHDTATAAGSLKVCEVGTTSRRLNRPLSRRVSLLIVRAGVSPTAVTVTAFALTMLAAVVAAAGARWPVALVAGGLLVQLAGRRWLRWRGR